MLQLILFALLAAGTSGFLGLDTAKNGRNSRVAQESESHLVQKLAAQDKQLSELSAEVTAMKKLQQRQLKIVNGEVPNSNAECACVCSGTTRRTSTHWIYYSPAGIYADVDITGCGFTKIPAITTSLEGSSSHWTTRGTSSVYSTTTSSFRIYIEAAHATTSNAKKWSWNIDWIAVGFIC